MSSIRWLVRCVLVIAVISTCALLALTVGMTRVGSIEEPPALRPGPDTGLPGTTQAQVSTEDLTPPRELSRTQDRTRYDVEVPNLVRLEKQKTAQALTDEGLRLDTASGDRAHRQNPVTERKTPPDSAVGIDRRTTPPVLVVVPNPGSRTVGETQLALAAVRFVLSSNPAGDRGVESPAMAAGTLIRPGNAVTVIVSDATMATVKPPGDPCGLHGIYCTHHTPTSRGSSDGDSSRGGSFGGDSSGRRCGPWNHYCGGSPGGGSPGGGSFGGDSFGRHCGPWNHYCEPHPGSGPPQWRPHRPEPPVPLVVKPPVAPIVEPPLPRVVKPLVPPVVELPVPPVVKPPVAPVVKSPVPPVVEPPVPPVGPSVASVVKSPMAPVGFSKLIPWLWSVIVALILLGVGLLALLGLLVWRAVRGRQEQKWVHAHVQAVAGATPSVDVEVMESRTDHSPPTWVVRIEPHADSGRQVLEEVH